MKQPKKKLAGLRIKQRVLYLLIFSFVTVLVWVGGSLFSSQSKSGISAELKNLAKPLNPVINVDLIREMGQKKHFTDQELESFQIYKLLKTKDGRAKRIIPIDSNEDDFLVSPSDDSDSNEDEVVVSPLDSSKDEVVVSPLDGNEDESVVSPLDSDEDEAIVSP
jgi:hypothetical protein